MKNRNRKGMQVPMALGWSLLISVLTTVLCCAAAAAMVASEWMGEERIVYASLITLLLASGAGAAVGGYMAKNRYLPVCLGGGLCYYVFLLCISGLFFDGTYSQLLPSAFAVLGGSGAAVLLLARSNTAPRRRNWKYKPS